MSRLFSRSRTRRTAPSTSCRRFRSTCLRSRWTWIAVVVVSAVIPIRMALHQLPTFSPPEITRTIDNESKQIPIKGPNNVNLHDSFVKSETEAPPLKTVVFYNLFIPPRDSISKIVQALVDDQFHQIATSYLAEQAAQHHGGLTIYVYALGYKVDALWLNRTCSVPASGINSNRLHCILVEHNKEGSELITLSRLHDHCRTHTSEAVVYLHDKGSFHPGPDQGSWRRALTAAATSRPCVDAVGHQSLHAPRDTCNACGLLFQPLPGMHYGGNMWMAQCSYISQLLSPIFPTGEYHVRIQQVEEWTQRQTARGRWTTTSNIFHLADWSMGRDRYAAEHWMGGHPSLQPCDVSSSTRDLVYWQHADDTPRNFATEFVQATHARHYSYRDHYDWTDYATNRGVLDDENLRHKDYFLLRGFMLRWLVYYDTLPDRDSWVWSWFPDVEYWQDQVARLGARAAVD